jgi:hypothetical protein
MGMHWLEYVIGIVGKVVEYISFDCNDKSLGIF